MFQETVLKVKIKNVSFATKEVIQYNVAGLLSDSQKI